MSDAACIDASIAAKWLLREVDRTAALSLRTDLLLRGIRLVAPYHLPGEISSAIYKRVRAGDITIEAGRLLTAGVTTLGVELHDSAMLHVRAVEIAAQLNLKWIYDAFYVALADIIGCELWTADAGLHRAVSGAFPHVRLLAELRQP